RQLEEPLCQLLLYAALRQPDEDAFVPPQARRRLTGGRPVARRGLASRAGGDNPGMRLWRWKRRGEEHRADKQQGDVHALDVEGDPRGGVQSEEYRTADPREVVVEDGAAMSAPGGAPQDGSTAEERRAEQRNDGDQA